MALPSVFGTTSTNLTGFLWHPLALNHHLYADLEQNIFIWVHIYNTWGKILWYNLYFISLLNGQSSAHKFCNHFSHILKIFSGIGAPIVAPPSDDFFKNLFPSSKSLSAPKNAANIVKIGLEKQTLCLIDVIHYLPTLSNCVSVTKKQ